MMLELWSIIIPLAASAVSGIAGWIVGRRKRDNDFLMTQQESINLLVENNKMMVGNYTEVNAELIKSKEENATLQSQVHILQKEVERLKRQNEGLSRKLKEMQATVDQLLKK